MVLWFLCPGAPEGSASSGSDFKATQKTGPKSKVSSDRLGEAGNQTCDPWFTIHSLIPYTTGPDVLPAIDETCDLLFVWELKTFWSALK